MPASSPPPCTPTPAAPGPTRRSRRSACSSGATAPGSTGAWSRSGSPRGPSSTWPAGTRRCGGSRPDRLPALRDAVRPEPEGARLGHRTSLPRDRRGAAGRAGQRVAALRALQLLASSPRRCVLDDDEHLGRVVGRRDRRHRPTVVRARSTPPSVTEAYQRDRAEARHRAGTRSGAPGKDARTRDGVGPLHAPSVIFERGGTRLVAGGWQPVEAYDVLVANLDPAIDRRAAPG